MEGWQASILIQAQAVVAEIEGMKAANEQERVAGNFPQYGEDAFLGKASELQGLSHAIQ